MDKINHEPTPPPADLRRALERLWPEVRRRHLFPAVPPPRLSRTATGAAIDLRSKQIQIDAAKAEELTTTLPAATVLTALLDHALSHHTYCPWDLSTHLRLYARARKLVGEPEMARKVTDLFIDVVADTHAVHRVHSPVAEVYRHLPRSPVDEVRLALYQRIWGVDLGGSAPAGLIRRLAAIPYLDRQRWPESLARFARIVLPYLEEELQRQPAVPGLDDHGFQRYTSDEIQQGLRSLAMEADGPEEFLSVVEDLQKDLAASPQQPGPGMGLGLGSLREANWLYYMKLAETYALPLKQTPMEDAGGLHPHAHRPWEIGQAIQDIDPWCSFGKILPGVTQVWQRRRGKIYGRERRAPDCIVVIDSSGSMADPSTQCSYAVLGAGCAADAYLRHDARVAVYNFSDAPAGDVLYLPFSRSRTLIYRALCRYFGGGTAVDLDSLQGLAEESAADLFLITDMQITNLDHLVSRLAKLDNRVTAVHVGKKPSRLRFIAAAARSRNIAVYGIGKPADIPRIMLGRVRGYLGEQQTNAGLGEI